MDIKVKTSNALSMLKTNKENHILEYKKQVQGWKKSMEEYEQNLAKWRQDTPEDIFKAEKYSEENPKPKEPLKPMAYTKDYDKYIELLEAHVEDNIQISEYEYQQIIKNQFNWTSTFLCNSNMYSK